MSVHRLASCCRARCLQRLLPAVVLWTLGIAGVGLLEPGPARADQAPDQLVRSVADQVLRAMRQDDGSPAGRYARNEQLIRREVAPHFDFERITRLALGRNWRLATPDQRNLLLERFSTLLIHT